VTPSYATPRGTERYAARFPEKLSAGFYRPAAGLQVSSLGLGTYLGELDEATDRSYVEAVAAAALGGINLLDTAINYRNQRSERCIGAALGRLLRAGEVQRDEIVVCTKAGFLTPGAVPQFLEPGDVVGQMHSMAPDFLSDQIDRSRSNLELDTLDVFYLHNPETQLEFVSRDVFEIRVRRAFARLEELRAAGKIRFFGTATWDGYRNARLLSVERLAAIAREQGGEDHGFRFIQLPLNIGMLEALQLGVLGQAAEAGISVIASASLLQTRVLGCIPEQVAAALPGLSTDAQRAIQFTRSAPGITAALAGMSRVAHVSENLAVSTTPPANWLAQLRAGR